MVVIRVCTDRDRYRATARASAGSVSTAPYPSADHCEPEDHTSHLVVNPYEAAAQLPDCPCAAEQLTANESLNFVGRRESNAESKPLNVLPEN